MCGKRGRGEGGKGGRGKREAAPFTLSKALHFPVGKSFRRKKNCFQKKKMKLFVAKISRQLIFDKEENFHNGFFQEVNDFL